MKSFRDVTVGRVGLDEILFNHTRWLAQKGGKRADLTDINLSFIDLRGVDLSYSLCRRVNISDSILDKARFVGASMVDAKIERNSLKKVNWNNADLRFSVFACNDMSGCSINSVLFDNSLIIQSDLRRLVNFDRSASFSGATIKSSTVSSDVHAKAVSHNAELIDVCVDDSGEN